MIPNEKIRTETTIEKVKEIMKTGSSEMREDKGLITDHQDNRIEMGIKEAFREKADNNSKAILTQTIEDFMLTIQRSISQ